MTDQLFELKILDLHWLEGIDEDNDLCVHGHLYLRIGDQVISDMESGDWTLSSTAMYLLRSMESDYEQDGYGNYILPCCGHFFIADDNENNVVIQGCNIGVDWKIKHINENYITHILQNGYEISIAKEIYRKIVLDFADQVEQFFKDSKPKVVPKDDFEKKGYLTFWKEWRKLRDKY
jgi:hypothetical protein